MKFWSIPTSNELGELRLDSGILRDMQGASRLEQKVSELFELLRDPIYRYVCRLIRKRAEAEDLTQETFLRLYDSLQKGHAMGNVRPWLYRVAHNLAIDWLRRRRARNLQARLRPLLITLAGDAPAMSPVIEPSRQAQILTVFRAAEQVSHLTDQLIAGETTASLPQTARDLLTELTRLDATLTTLEKN